MASVQTGRFARAFTPGGVLGQGGFGQVYRAFGGGVEQESCAVKVIKARLRRGEAIEQVDDVWSGGDVFQRLQRLTSPHVVRYHDYWLEESHPVATATAADEDGNEMFGIEASPSVRPEQQISLVSAASSDDGFEWIQEVNAVEVGEAAAEIKAAAAARPTLQSEVFLLVQMEYCSGITLHEWLYDPTKRAVASSAAMAVPGGTRIEWEGLSGAVALGLQLLQGLSAIHDAGLVHRDIKPGNLHIDFSSGLLRIYDFGLARCFAGTETRKREEGRALGVGSPGYAAPEQWAHVTADPPHPSADIFSAGVVLLDMVAAVLPVWSTAMQRAATILGIQQGSAELPVSVPGPLQSLILRMTDICPASRPTARMSSWEISNMATVLGAEVQLVE